MEEERNYKKSLFQQVVLEGNKVFLPKNVDGNQTSFTEVIPSLDNFSHKNVLSLDSSRNLVWIRLPDPLKIQEGIGISISKVDGRIIIDTSLNLDFNIIEKDKIKETEIYYKDGRMGIGRFPLHTYKFDIAVPENTVMTAFHVGDGKYGFSMGNGSPDGFIPEIIGMGSDENDAGLYFLGRAGNNKESEIPLIIFDGRNNRNGSLKNRPIFGITSGKYNEYKLLVDSNGRIGIGKIPEIYKLEIEGSVQAEDVIIKGLDFKSLIDIIKEHQKEIDRLKDLIELFQKNK